MPLIEKITTRKIVGDYGSLKRYAEEKNLSYSSLRIAITVLGASCKKVVQQLEEDGYGEYLKTDRQNMANEFIKQNEAVNGP